MTHFETIPDTYAPEALVPGTTINLDEVLEGNCWNGMPAVIIESDSYRYPETEEEYEEHGARIPLLADIEIGCANYHALRNLPMPVELQDCDGCPFKPELA